MWQPKSPPKQPSSSLQELRTSADQQLLLLRQLSVPVHTADELLSRLNGKHSGSINTDVKGSATHPGTGTANSRPTGSHTGCKPPDIVGSVLDMPVGPNDAQMVSLLRSSIEGVVHVLEGLQAAETAQQQRDTARRVSLKKTPPAEADLSEGE